MTEPTPIRFTIGAAAASDERPAESSATIRSKAPKICDASIMGARAPTTRPPATTPVNICIYEISDNAGDMWALRKDSPAKLWQVQVEHAARPSISINIVNQRRA